MCDFEILVERAQLNLILLVVQTVSQLALACVAVREELAEALVLSLSVLETIFEIESFQLLDLSQQG